MSFPNGRSMKRPKMFFEKERSSRSVGLALSGGAAVGIAHIGAVRALREAGIGISHLSGTSAGAVVAACVAFGVSEERMIEATRKLSWSNISDFGYSKFGLNSNRPVGELMTDLVGDVRIEDAPIPLAIVATDIDTGDRVVFRKGDLAAAIQASTCIPGYFVPVEIDGKKLVDGGIIENLPLPTLRSMRPRVTVGIDLGLWRTIGVTKNILDVVTNSYSILVRHQADHAAHKASVIVSPHLEGFSISDFDRVDKLIDAGYRATRRKIPEIVRRIGSGGILSGIRSGLHRVFARMIPEIRL